MEISNKTKRPLRVPLPGGKKLHLGPLATAKIPARADQHPPLKKLIDAGEIEIHDDARTQGTAGSGGGKVMSSSQGGAPTRGLRRTGDR